MLNVFYSLPATEPFTHLLHFRTCLDEALKQGLCMCLHLWWDSDPLVSETDRKVGKFQPAPPPPLWVSSFQSSTLLWEVPPYLQKVEQRKSCENASKVDNDFIYFCSRRAWQAFGAPQDTRQSLDHIVVGRCTTSFLLLHSHSSVPIASSNFSIWQNKGDNKHVKKTQLMWDWQKPPSIFLQEHSREL